MESSGESELDSEVEVFPLQESDADENCSSSEAWGNRRNLFYNTNQSDDNSFEDGVEEDEVNLIEQRIYSAMNHCDFESHWLDVVKDHHSSDMDPLTDKLKLKEESPILFQLIKSFKDCFSWILCYGIPILQGSSLLAPDGNCYIQAKIHLLFCYCVDVLYYLLLRACCIRTSIHPVTSQLVLLHKLLSPLRKPELTGTVSNLLKAEIIEVPVSTDNVTPAVTLGTSKHVKKRELASKISTLEVENFEPETRGKRAITFQMARNKGLTPNRKREQRNPRVKHRSKYRKALIKRRSQVLPVIHEMQKYSGESSGIRSKIARSVQIK